MSRERRERMTETFVAVSDALRRALVQTVAMSVDRLPDLPRPSYLPEVPPQTVGEYRAALGKLGRLGLVKVH
jgi:hypothetical protein